MTNKKGAGGAREGAGRKPKILEIKLIEQMDAISVPNEIWNALLFKCKEGDTAAIKLWLSYRFGLPKQQIDVTSNGEKIAPPIQWIGRNVAIEAAKVISEDDEQSEDELNEKEIAELKNRVQSDYEKLIDNDEQNEQKNNWF
jgi:hypothetical protein